MYDPRRMRPPRSAYGLRGYGDVNPVYPAPTAGMVQGAGGQVSTFQGGRIYSNNSTSIAASGTQTIQTIFPVSALVYAIGGAAEPATLGSSQGTASICYRDAYTLLIQRQTGDALITNAVLASALLGPDQAKLYLDEPWQVFAGETLNATVANQSSNTAITVWVLYHVIEQRVAAQGG